MRDKEQHVIPSGLRQDVQSAVRRPEEAGARCHY